MSSAPQNWHHASFSILLEILLGFFFSSIVFSSIVQNSLMCGGLETLCVRIIYLGLPAILFTVHPLYTVVCLSVFCMPAASVRQKNLLQTRLTIAPQKNCPFYPKQDAFLKTQFLPLFSVKLIAIFH